MAKKIKAKRIKKENYVSEDQNEIKHFIIILIIILLLIVGAYFFTRIFVSKDLLNNEEKTVTPGNIDYDTTLIGAMLNKPEEEYYVMLYNNKDADYIYYTGIANNYSNVKNHLKIYLADISNELNKNYISEEENLKIENIEDFKINTPTLLKIKKGKVSDVYKTKEEMADVLKAVND